MLYLGAIGAAVIAAAWLMITATSYQLDRIQSFLDPFRDPLGTASALYPGRPSVEPGRDRGIRHPGDRMTETA